MDGDTSDTTVGGAPLGPTPAPAASPTSQMDHEERLQTILQVAKTLASGRGLEALLPEFLADLVRTIRAADAGLILLYEAGENLLVLKSSYGYDPEHGPQIQLTPGESMSGKVFESGQAALFTSSAAIAAAMDDMSSENRQAFIDATGGLDQPRSTICVPLTQGENKVGVLTLMNLRQPDLFSPVDIPFLQAVADLIALAISSTRLAEDLRAAQAFTEANRLKAELLSTLAHEMRTPLTSIKGYSTALLMEEADFSQETQHEFLQTIDEECDILQDLIHDLLESSVIEAGLLKLERQPVILQRLAKEVIDDIAHRSRKHRFVVDFPEGYPIVEADPLRIMQVLRNLLDNAIKYSPQGGLIVVRGEALDDEVHVSVADQGVGIAPDDLNRLFEKFFRVKSGLIRNVVGSGLGLPIARTIVERHGGRIWAESKMGQGSTLHFTLPRTNLGQELAGQ